MKVLIGVDPHKTSVAVAVVDEVGSELLDDRLLGCLLGGGDHREAAYPRRLGSLPLGRAYITTTLSPIDGSSKLAF